MSVFFLDKKTDEKNQEAKCDFFAEFYLELYEKPSSHLVHAARFTGANSIYHSFRFQKGSLIINLAAF